MIRLNGAASAIANREDIPQAAHAAIAQKVADLKAAGKTAKEAYLEIHTGRYVDNPEPRALVPRTEWAPDELKNLLLQATDPNTGAPVWLTIRALEQSQNQQLAALGRLIPEVFTLKAISLQNPLVTQAIGALRQAGILSDDLYTAIVKQPDPGWQPVVWEPAFVETVLGTDAALEWSEFVELWNASGG